MKFLKIKKTINAMLVLKKKNKREILIKNSYLAAEQVPDIEKFILNFKDLCFWLIKTNC